MSIRPDLLASVAVAVYNVLVDQSMDNIFIGNWALKEIFEPPDPIPLSITGLDVVVLGVKRENARKRLKKIPGPIRFSKEKTNRSVNSHKKLILEWRSEGYPIISIDVHFGKPIYLDYG